ncbi:Dihydroorotate dehydrogenase B (NAD(+)), catalytic subunit [compost metagenome]|jgi:dihydroorotate dehydrogenase (NAD+) catalytic subunit|uniref:Dihydroorotate dehydrogenase n=2 Tax=Agrobacterium tumefaciens complex TaxID=1183400 RepID=A0AAW8LYB0_AGRTU|nr:MULTISPECIES: dihydroorotate dehydrogenase [Agrobacterium tumefaciens complex]MCP2136368.1 dihydroorotate dehydrogenase (NAD+) catalytic subunit [Rhizobium sp. SLBN-94]TGE77436.1 dihydroorotate dehydrogenase [Rhizobium sp. SEMIA 439]KAA1233141.1 dihydroorotate dehydrogenase [Agrobacterium tumefaciens]KAB0456220.1 dihydroorotate dehydrogenase [Agrobacterium tumefaciens]KWT79016.1 dihydroorotate dehydrogenase [Agrobacterium radiobacter]
MTDLSTRIGTLSLKNPIMPASGTFSEELADVFDLDCIGAHVTKTITRERRSGNPVPRVCEIRGAMLNSIGIPSKGAEWFVRNTIPFYTQYEAPLVVSISAGTADDFARFSEEISIPGVDAIEVNISCPNIEDHGKAFAMRPGSTENVIRKIRDATDLPLWAKLSPNTGEVVEVAQAAEAAGANALVAANTMLAMAIDSRTGEIRLGNVMGGLSGPAIKPITLRMTYQCANAVSIPVIGCGGISTVDDVIEYLMAGARAVQVGTATFISPNTMPRLVRELEAALIARGLASVDALIGTAKLARETIALAEYP